MYFLGNRTYLALVFVVSVNTEEAEALNADNAIKVAPEIPMNLLVIFICYTFLNSIDLNCWIDLHMLK